MKNHYARLIRHVQSPALLDSLESRLLLSSSPSSQFFRYSAAVTPALTANSPPTKLKLSLDAKSISPNATINLSGTFADKDATDTHNISIDWGDGSPATTLQLAAGVLSFGPLPHVYTVSANYSIQVRVADPTNPNISATTTLPVLSYDLVPSFTLAPKLADSIITGAVVTGTVPVTITNTGNGPSPAATVTILLRSSTPGIPDFNITPTAAAIPSIKGSTTKNGTTTTNSKTINVKVTIPLTLAAGSYSLVVIINDSSTQGTPANTNNTLVDTNFTLTAAPGAVNISTNLTLPKFPTTIVQGTKASGNVTLTFTNSGNIPTTSIAHYDILLVAQPSSGDPIPVLATHNVTIPVIKADGGQFTVTGPLSVSASDTAQTPPGTYTFIARLTPVNGTAGGVITVTGPTVTILPASNTGGSLLKHGDTIKFTATTELTGGNFAEFGSFVTNTNTFGGYSFTPAGLVLTYADNTTDTLIFTFTGSQVFLDPTVDANPTTVTFSAAPLNGKTAFANVTINSNNTLNFATYA